MGFHPRNSKSTNLRLFINQPPTLSSTILSINNERLEFLGDAILDSLVAEYLFHKYPDKEEGFLTQTRSKIVNRENLNNIAIKLGIGDMIITKMPKENHRSVVYGDALEALIGALYLDKGYKEPKKIVTGADHSKLQQYSTTS